MSTYRFWAERLDRVAKGDDTAIDELADADLAWQPGVAERVALRTSEAFTTRLEEVNRRLQRDLDGCGSVHEVGQAMARAQRGLEPLMRLGALPSLPERLQQHLTGELRRVVGETQASLEQSLRPDHDGAVRLLAEVRRHRLTAVLDQPAPAGPRPREPLQRQRGRRLII